MLAKLTKLMMVVVLVSLLAGPAVVLADTDGGWTELKPGEQHWYAVDYRGHHEFEEADEEEGEEAEAIFVQSEIQVSMDVEPDGGAVFGLITPDEIRAWEAGEDLESCGCGTENEFEAGDLFWSGSFSQPGTYYVLVQYAAAGTDPVYYTLSIGGEDVAVTGTPEATSTADAAAADASSAGAESAAAKPVAEAGTGPGDALTPGDEAVLLPVGETLWYAFDYHGHHEFPEADGDDEEDKEPVFVATQVEIWLDAEPDEGAAFSIWNQDQIRLWVAGEEFEPVGQGTKNEFEAGDLFWAGSFPSAGRYYIVVEQQGPEPVSLLLNISGEDVY